jgi:predicted ribosomally synthesized peptide with SipW-like signal peptide
MKRKIGLISIALVLALGGLGIGYAGWTDSVTISGPVTTGDVCIEFSDPYGYYIIEQGGTPDLNWTSWIAGTGVSCPPEGEFDGVGPNPEGKEVGYLDMTSVVLTTDADGFVKQLDFTIMDAYPYYACSIAVYVKNCGTIPVKVNTPVFTQDEWLLIEYWDGEQVEPGATTEISFMVGVTQWGNWFDGEDWHVNDPNEPLCPQDTPLSFSVTIHGTQFNE